MVRAATVPSVVGTETDPRSPPYHRVEGEDQGSDRVSQHTKKRGDFSGGRECDPEGEREKEGTVTYKEG